MDKTLSPRELEVLKLLTQGKMVKTISRELNMTYQTTKNHLAHIYLKLDLNSNECSPRMLAARYYWENIEKS